MVDTTQYISEVYNEDCMIGMARYPDKWFDLAVVDPPYGITENSYRKVPSKKAAAKKKDYNMNLWAFGKPNKEYWSELLRVSKNQIVWGGNYFTDNLYESRCWIVWDKCTQDSLFADVEMAWTSWQNSAKLFKYRWNGMLQQDMSNKEIRVHPTQKPVALYDWIYKNYLPQGGKVIDTHLGSGSNRIAANKAGNIDFVGFELDRDYYEAQEKRWKGFIAQTRLF